MVNTVHFIASILLLTTLTHVESKFLQANSPYAYDSSEQEQERDSYLGSTKVEGTSDHSRNLKRDLGSYYCYYTYSYYYYSSREVCYYSYSYSSYYNYGYYSY